MSQAKSFIVKRMTHDGDKGGPDTYHYQKVTNPNPGELIYHGQFTSGRSNLQTTDQWAPFTARCTCPWTHRS